MKKNKKIIFTSGGTGGHIFPAIGIMQHFINKGYNTMLISDLRGIQFLKNNLEIKFYILNTDTPLNKKYHKKFFSYIIIFLSIIRSIFLLKKEKPNLVFGLGGYVSFPISVAAKFLNIPLIIYENNYVLGRTNKYLLSFAKKLLIATDTISNCPKKYKNKIVKVGHILREDILNYSSFENKNKSDYFSILILGGSQGAEIFGKIVPEVIKRVQQFGYKINIYHQCINKQHESLIHFYNENKINNNVFVFSSNILKYISKANIAISRCGASTMAELVYLRTPFIAVPYPYAMDNHQYLNAKIYEEKGYCWLLEQANFKDENLFNLIIKILKDKNNLEKVRENMKNNDSKYTNQNIENTIKEFI